MPLQQIQLPCGACGKALVQVSVAVSPRVVNMDSVSLVVLEHSPQVLCECGAVLQLAIMGVPHMTLALAPVPQQQQQQIIIPPGVLQ